MIANPSIDQLAAGMRDRYQLNPPGGTPAPGAPVPYILFLGEGCAEAAGVPSRVEIARQALRILKYDKVEDSEPDSVVFDKFARATSSFSQQQLSRMLKSLYSQTPVPSFYQYLAQLIRERFFPLIMTMSIDTLLEQALAGSGVRQFDYRVTTFGGRDNSKPYGTGPSAPLTHIVKLNGDLAQDVVQITPEQIEQALRLSAQWIKADLRGDMIMVEHLLIDHPIDRWLSHSPDRELWWVSAEPPLNWAKVETWSASPVSEIVGDVGRPQVFFPQLALRLLSSSGHAPAEDADETPQLLSFSVSSRSLKPPPSSGMAESLQKEILRNQSVLLSLDQESTGGERPPQVQKQIEYQKQQISRLEDRIRSVPEVREEILSCVQRISERIREQSPSLFDADTAGAMVQYVEAQRSTIGAEFQRESPNQILISASLGATLALADRLLTEFGSQIVDPEDLKRLATFTPTAASKVVL